MRGSNTKMVNSFRKPLAEGFNCVGCPGPTVTSARVLSAPDEVLSARKGRNRVVPRLITVSVHLYFEMNRDFLIYRLTGIFLQTNAYTLSQNDFCSESAVENIIIYLKEKKI